MFYAVKTSHAWAMRALLMLTANIQDVPTGRARGIYPVMIDVPMASSKHTVSKESAGITTCVTTDMSMKRVHIHHQPTPQGSPHPSHHLRPPPPQVCMCV